MMRTEGLKDVDLISLLSLEKLCVFVIRNFVKKEKAMRFFFIRTRLLMEALFLFCRNLEVL
jgi:hypothetical protein